MFRIGEFSRLAMVSIRMLRHYDEIGLLTPNTVDPYTGYRYYSAGQLGTVSRIQLLREMGVSLGEIKKLFDDMQQLNEQQQIQQMQTILTLQQSLLKQQLMSANHKLSLVQSALDRLRKEQTMKRFHVEKKVFPAVQVAAVRDILPSYADEHQLWMQMHEAFVKLGPGDKLFGKGFAMAVFFDEGFCEKDVDVEIRVQLPEDFHPNCDQIEKVRFVTIPSVTAATAILNGSYEQISQVYEEIAQWVEENNFQMQGPMFNIYHVSPAMDQNPDNWVTEVCVPLNAE